MPSDDGISFVNATAKDMISSAYGIRGDLISGGPGWSDSSGYDVEAKVVAADESGLLRLKSSQRRLMMQSLLSDCFKLVVHTETKEVPIYELTIAKGGSKLKEAKPRDTYSGGVQQPTGPAGAGVVLITDGMFTGQGITLSRFVGNLSQALHNTVVDKKGLTGTYDISVPMPMGGLRSSGHEYSAPRRTRNSRERRPAKVSDRPPTVSTPPEYAQIQRC
ncbi:MAG: TIGR03435 family protein [Acidobacteriota bacterium]|nr:TIGR03435 family protein [Acidobacteriota bacterium]